VRRRHWIGLAVSSFLLSPLFPQSRGAPVFEIHPWPQSRFALEVFKTGLWEGRKHLFLFQNYAGTLSLDLASPESAAMHLTLEAASAVCQDTWVSQSDLKKIQNQAFSMMDVANHAQLVFSSQRIVPLGANRYEVEGSLDIGGVAKPVTVHVTVSQQDDGTLVFVGATRLRMKDYGLKPPSAALGLIGTKDEMAVAFLLRATRVQ
jgi:polyisoprenoid-binding protein YceI